MNILNQYPYLAFDFDSTIVTMDVDWGQVRQDLLNFLRNNYQFDGDSYPIHQMIDVASEKHGPEVKQEAQILMQKHENNCSFTNNQPLVNYLLQTDQPWAILSNNCASTIERILKDISLQPSLTLAFEDIAQFKPHPDGIQIILDHFSIQPNSLIFSGDKITDQQTAEACQVSFVYVQDLPQEPIS